MDNKTLSECSKEELLDIIKNLKRRKKFGLVWEDKPEKVATECARKLPVVKEIEEKVISEAGIAEPTHFIIEGDNYHALSVLNYTHAGKIDAIYIDPPYNTGARDWKYNNNYVDGNDVYRHSKWLSMMEKRLKLARHLLKPDNSVLICTIDEKECLHIGCLLEEIFPEATIQMISSVINPAGVSRQNQFYRTDEYIFFVMLGSAHPQALPLGKEWQGNITTNNKSKLQWNQLQRSGTSVLRTDRPNMFYPIFLDASHKKIVSIGTPIPLGVDRKSIIAPPGTTAIWPIFPDGREGRWRISHISLEAILQKHYVRIGRFNGEQTPISYVARGEQEKVESGKFPIIGYRDDGSIIVDESSYTPEFIPGTQWWIPTHNATQFGTKLVNKILPHNNFPFPKSLYAVQDALRFFITDNKTATVLDFFAGSGTTGQAVLELNKEDGGHRQFILCTNNENKIAEEVTYPRVRTVVTGRRKDGSVYSDGIRANLRYFKTEFIEKDETLDKLRRKLSPVCEDMIRIREGAFDKVIDEDKFKVYRNSRGLTAVVFDRFELADYIAQIEELETDASVHLYVFSYTNYGRFDELSDDLRHTYESQPIPEGVLEIYKRIFSKGGKR